MRRWFLLAPFSLDHMINPVQGETIIPGPQNRNDFIKMGKVWAEPDYDIASQNLLESSPECPKFSPSDVIACHYLKPKRGEEISG